MADWAVIEADIDQELRAAGYELVEMQVHSGRGARLTLLVDRLGEPGTVSLDDCSAISQQVSDYLDRVDPFKGSYQLQVSSPGVDRPLRKLEHVQQFLGRRARVRYRGEGGPVTVEGELQALEGEVLVVVVAGEPVRVPWSQVQRAHLVYDWGD